MSTKTGDDGTTGLVGGSRVSKASLRIEACGAIDELNSQLGVVRTIASGSGSALATRLAKIQNDLFTAGAEVATPPGVTPTVRITETETERLEEWIREGTAVLPPLDSFVLPGGTEENAHLHLARAVCRRAERRLCRLSETEEVSFAIIKFFNRLSDYLFVEARMQGRDREFLWQVGGDAPKPAKDS